MGTIKTFGSNNPLSGSFSFVKNWSFSFSQKKNLIHAAAVAAKIAHCKAPIKQPLWALLLAGKMKKKSETWAPEKRRRGEFFSSEVLSD